jgi:hypothetical protein
MPQVAGYQFRRTTLWLVFFLSVLIGLGWAHTGRGLSGWWCLLQLPVLMLIVRKRNWLAVLSIILFGISCGWWRGSIYMHKLAEYDLWQKREVTISARAMNDALYNSHKALAFDVNHVVLQDGEALAGKVQLSGFGVNAAFQGDEVTATGKFYPGYGAYQAEMSFARITVTAHHPTLVGRLRQKFTAGMQTAVGTIRDGLVSRATRHVAR